MSPIHPGGISDFEFRIFRLSGRRTTEAQRHRGQHRVFLGQGLMATVTGPRPRGLNPPFGAYSRRAAGAEGLVARAGRRREMVVACDRQIAAYRGPQ